MRVVRALLRTCVLGTALFAAACEDSDTLPLPPDGGARPDGGAVVPLDGGIDGGREAKPLYLVNTTEFEGDEATTYFSLLPAVGPGAALTAKGLPEPGMAKLYARDGLGWFALGGGEEPTITRYTLDSSDGFVKGDKTLTLQPNAVSYLGDTVVFVSNTQAYYFDAPGHQLIRWNPEAMTVDKEIELPATAHDGVTTIFDLKPLLRADGKLVFPVSWRDFTTNAVHPYVGLVVFDTRTDTLVKYTETDRCQGVTWSTHADNGDLYLATAPFYAALQRVNSLGAPACVLRVNAGGDDFDPTYKVELASLVGGRVAGGLERGPSGTFFFRAVEPGTTVDASTDPSDVWASAVWRWVSWNPTSNETRTIDTLPPSAAGGLTFDVDGKVYATNAKDDFSETTLIDLTAPGGPEPALTAPGYIYGLVRYR